jgi:hypothetical protein
MTTQNKAQQLISAIRKANQASINAATNDDSGTCNLDLVFIDLDGFSQSEISEVLNSQYVDATHFDNLIYELHFTVLGQANNRTRMMKAAAQSLQNDGYKAFINYQMD